MNNKLEEKRVSKLWTGRGKVIEVLLPDEYKYLRKGFLRLTPDEAARHRVGDYSPIYDKGEEYRSPTAAPEPPPEVHKLIAGDLLTVLEV